MNIQDTEIVDLVSQIEEVEQKLLAHPMHKVVLNVVFLWASELKEKKTKYCESILRT